MYKNTAGQKWIVFAFQDEGGTNPGEPVTGDAANITANLRLDGGAANAVDDLNPTELEDGYYVFDITQAESNADLILITPASATANVNVIGVPGAVWTTTDVSGVEAKIDTVDTNVDAVLVDTNELQTDWTDGGRLDLIIDAILADTGTDGVAISATVANAIADALLNRDMSAVSDTNGRSPLNALRLLRNKYSVSGTTLTVTKEDDATSAWTSTLTTDATADPVTGSDPA